MRTKIWSGNFQLSEFLRGDWGWGGVVGGVPQKIQNIWRGRIWRPPRPGVRQLWRGNFCHPNRGPARKFRRGKIWKRQVAAPEPFGCRVFCYEIAWRFGKLYLQRQFYITAAISAINETCQKILDRQLFGN